ncbi:MAG: hypothetical protein M1830_000128 [Pleopsidium flavum]|nr:MAG: hypothetical protein M1830_000128 [Pleopsidium flavum]
MSELPCPHFFVSRTDGTKTPLIAVDELPSNIRLLGVARTITDAQTQGMISLGVLPSSKRCYVVEDEDASSTSSSSFGPARQLESGVQPMPAITGFQAPDSGLDRMTGLSSAHEEASKAEKNRDLALIPHSGNAGSIASWRRPGDRDDETQAIIDAVVSASVGSPRHHDSQISVHPAPSGIPPGQGKKVYCTYWIRKGECDYTQQGCMYKHAMPLDKETLASLGLREVPRWYREQYARDLAVARNERTRWIDCAWRPSATRPLSPNVNPAPPFSLPPPPATTLASASRQQRLITPGLALPPPIRPSIKSAMSQQQRLPALDGTFGSPARGNSMANLRPRTSSQLGSAANVAKPTESTFATGRSATVATEQVKPAQRLPEPLARDEKQTTPSPEDLLARIPAMTPSPAASQSGSPSVGQSLRRAGTSSTSTFFPGVPRTSSPAHPRMFVKEGQEKFAVNQVAETPEKTNATIASKSSTRSVGKQTRQTLNIFGK